MFNFDGEVIGIHSRIAKDDDTNFHAPIESYLEHWDLFKTGTMIVALEDVNGYDSLPVQSYNPAQPYFVKLYKQSGTGDLEVLPYAFNTLVAEFLHLDPENDDIRGDSRLFKYPDGSAGVFIERTGQFFVLSEIDIGN